MAGEGITERRSSGDEERGLPGFAGIRTFMRFPHPREEDDLGQVDLAVVGLPFDNGVSHRPGARFGPSAIREVSGFLRTYNPSWDIAPMEHLTGIDLGDSPVVPGNTGKSLLWMEETVERVVDAGIIPLCLGGDHTVSLPVLRAVAAVHGPVGIVHLDSHPDTWDGIYGEKYNHATPFRRAADESLILPEHSIQMGIRGSVGGAEDLITAEQMGFTTLPAERLLQMRPQEVGEEISRVTAGRPFYMSFDVDFLDPAFAPGTGTPEVGGPTSAQCLSYLRSIDFSNLVGLDVVEVLPAHDSSQITALAAANVIYEVICGLAVSRTTG